MRPTRIELLKQILDNQKVLLRQSIQTHVTYPDMEIAMDVIKDTEFILSKDYPKVVKKNVPQQPKKNIKLKEVQDDNYSSAYMYPEDKVKKEKVVKVADATPAVATTVSTSNTMSKEECVNMIGQAKFDKYTQMFGNEASSIKRCAMLKSMQ